MESSEGVLHIFVITTAILIIWRAGDIFLCFFVLSFEAALNLLEPNLVSPTKYDTKIENEDPKGLIYILPKAQHRSFQKRLACWQVHLSITRRFYGCLHRQR